ncbi:MAG: hypothetical protein GWN58_31230 [Anaerolineae bacterium]|nr:hypothetical protein [Anaerolineae bacterium]
MPTQELLMLAVTKMLGGVCVAGMTSETDSVTGLRWVRPVREFGHVLLGDITTPDRLVLRPFDVVEFSLISPRPDPPHTEDWIADFVHQRPRIVRRLEGERRAGFLEKHLDAAPLQVLQGKQRSLCLVGPDWVKGSFHLDLPSGDLNARLAFGLDGRTYSGSHGEGGLSVTDLKWRALGRAWLAPAGGRRDFDIGDLEVEFGIGQLYLVVGLTRSFQGSFWPIIVGVHTAEDYKASVDYDNL